jgi:hypothetical protein
MISIYTRIFIFLLALPALSANGQAGENPYRSTLLKLCHTLKASQIQNPGDPNFGALLCPSRNPDTNKIHSRAGEAVYPFAVAFRITGDTAYRNAAIRLGNWLVSIQDLKGQKAGGWSEDWPDPEQKNWFGTTTDQLISLAGAYAILRPWLTNSERDRWNVSMESASEFIVKFFPIGGNINYSPTAAATLLLTQSVCDRPRQSWLQKADSLMYRNTLPFIDSTGLLTGEGMGIDGGYNIAQSIGYITLYGMLKKDEYVLRKASELMGEQFHFVYPNGSVDNSWGTRSFKWQYESGTKTAPGVYFGFALLANRDPRFHAAGMKCLEYLNRSSIRNGWVSYGPHAARHRSSEPPCIYSTFARAQSLALSVEYGSVATGKSTFPGALTGWHRYFPSLNVVLVRTKGIMATVSAYGAIGRYGRASVSRGGSITNLWFEGFGSDGFLQSSSTGDYQRTEPRHMPVENGLYPLTPRIECRKDTAMFSNIFESDGKMTTDNVNGYPLVRTEGSLRDIRGNTSNERYVLTHSFYDNRIVKEYTVEGRNEDFRIIEPIVRDDGTRFERKNDSTVLITTGTNKRWELNVSGANKDFRISLGEEAEKYWAPFPGVEAYPVIISFRKAPGTRSTIRVVIRKV